MTHSINEVSNRSGDFKGFIHAVMQEDLDAVSYYISIGMDINHLHPEIMTNGLIEAVKVGNLEIVQLLMDHGADPHIVSQLGESAIVLAKSKNDPELIQLFGADESYFSRFIKRSKKSLSNLFPSSRPSNPSSNSNASS
mgnify:CR=1 FL=1